MGVSLDADNPGAPLYTIVTNESDHFSIAAGPEIIGEIGHTLVGVVQLDKLAVDAGVVLRTDDRLQASSYELADFDSVAGIADLVADRSNQQIGNYSALNQVRTLFGDVTADSILLDHSKITAAGGIQVAGSLSIFASGPSQDSRVQAEYVTVGGDLIVDGAVLQLSLHQPLHVDGNLVLRNGGRITVDPADVRRQLIHRLDLDIGGNLSVDSTSSIDVEGKGFPAGYFGPDFLQGASAAHAGISGEGAFGSYVNSEYGRYENAAFAGSSGGFARAAGGGAVWIHAGSIDLDGEIVANGEETSDDASAGGSLWIETARLAGAGTMHADGGFANGGGRISVYADDAGSFIGTSSAVGGASQNGLAAGAGTIYLKDTTGAHLDIENGGSASSYFSTPLRYVGRQSVVSAEPAGPGLWRIVAGDEPIVGGSGGLVGDTDNSAGMHHFKLPSGGHVNLEMSYASFDTKVYLFQENAGSVGDLIASSAGSGLQLSLDLPAGDYVLAVVGYSTSELYAAQGINTGAQGHYVLNIDGPPAIWRPSRGDGAYGLDGLYVSLDADNSSAPLFRIASNDAAALVVESTDDLSGYVGKSMVGVQSFETLRITGGAFAGFGDDRVIVHDSSHSLIDGDQGCDNSYYQGPVNSRIVCGELILQ